MIRINLLPYREEKRKARRQQFYGLLGVAAVLGCLVVFAVYSVIEGYLTTQQSRNDFIRKEIAVLNKQIEEIKRIREQAQDMLSRKQIIESLQQDRTEAVILLNELAKQIPEGVYLHSLKQQGQQVTLAGFAQSSPRVSIFMRNIGSSQWLGNARLVEIKSVNMQNRQLDEFSMVVTIKRTQNQEAAKE